MARRCAHRLAHSLGGARSPVTQGARRVRERLVLRGRLPPAEELQAPALAGPGHDPLPEVHLPVEPGEGEDARVAARRLAVLRHAHGGRGQRPPRAVEEVDRHRGLVLVERAVLGVPLLPVEEEHRPRLEGRGAPGELPQRVPLLPPVAREVEGVPRVPEGPEADEEDEDASPEHAGRARGRQDLEEGGPEQGGADRRHHAPAAVEAGRLGDLPGQGLGQLPQHHDGEAGRAHRGGRAPPLGRLADPAPAGEREAGRHGHDGRGEGRPAVGQHAPPRSREEMGGPRPGHLVRVHAQEGEGEAHRRGGRRDLVPPPARVVAGRAEDEHPPGDEEREHGEPGEPVPERRAGAPAPVRAPGAGPERVEQRDARARGPGAARRAAGTPARAAPRRG